MIVRKNDKELVFFIERVAEVALKLLNIDINKIITFVKEVNEYNDTDIYTMYHCGELETACNIINKRTYEIRDKYPNIENEYHSFISEKRKIHNMLLDLLN